MAIEYTEPLEKFGPGELELYDELPWDSQCTLTNAVDLFGYLGNGERIGQHAQFLGPYVDIDDNEGETDHLIGNVGTVIGDFHGRIVLDLDEGYLGWLNPEEFRVVHMIDPETPYIL